MRESILAASIVLLVFIGIGMLILQIINYRSLKKSKEHFSNLHTSLKPGVKVMTTGGIYGKVLRADEEIIDLEIAKGIVIQVSRYSIKDII